MKRLGIIGLCFVGVLAFSAMIASSASANPQFYHCKNITHTGESLQFIGPFPSQANCEALTSKGTGTWWFSEYEGVETTAIEGTSPEGNLNGLVAGLKVSVKCEKDKFTGTINSGKGSMLVSNILVEYEKCKVGTGATPCTGGSVTTGNIMTKKIMATLGYTVATGGGATNVGLVFEPEEAGATFVNFTCSGLPEVVVTKQVIGLIPQLNAAGESQINIKRNSLELRFECTAPGGDVQRHEGLLLLPSSFATGLHLVAFGNISCLEDVVNIKTTTGEKVEVMA